MFNTIKYTGIGAVVATCHTMEEIGENTLVKMADNGTVEPCQAGDKFCGMAMQPRGAIAGVQFKGFMTVACTGELIPGSAVSDLVETATLTDVIGTINTLLASLRAAGVIAT